MKIADESIGAIDVHAALGRVGDGGTLDAADSARVFRAIMTGMVADDKIADFLIQQAARGPTVDEIVGAARALRAQMHTINAPPDAIDLCGTGGDGLGTLNISTAVSFVAAGAGAIIAKHGNRSASSKSGAADILEALGVNIRLAPARAAQVLAETGIVFLFAQTHHPAMARVAAVRKQIGRRTIFNLLGPLLSPAGVTRQLVGIFGKNWLLPYAQALQALGGTRAMVVHGADGLDELTTTDLTYFACLQDGQITSGEIAPEDAGLERASLADLKGGTPRENADALRALLEGGGSKAYRDIVLLNAAAALMVAGKANDLQDGVAMAKTSIDSGQAQAKLDALIKTTNA